MPIYMHAASHINNTTNTMRLCVLFSSPHFYRFTLICLFPVVSYHFWELPVQDKMRLLSAFVLLTFLACAAIAQAIVRHSDSNPRVAHHKRAAFTSKCDHSKDCHHVNIHGGRPKCSLGKCTFSWVSLNQTWKSMLSFWQCQIVPPSRAFIWAKITRSASSTAVIVGAIIFSVGRHLIDIGIERDCGDDVPDHSKAICNSHGHCDFLCDKNYAKSSKGDGCERICKHGMSRPIHSYGWYLHYPLDSACHTNVAHATPICLPSKRCGFKCESQYDFIFVY
jgi:hypothetical protein